MTVGQVMAKLGVDSKEYEKGLKQAEKEADKSGSRIGNIFKNAFSVTLGMGMFETLKRGIKSTVGAAVDFNSMLQTAQIGFATMLGSAERAQTFLDDMAKFAARTPFEYPELLDASKKMLAYGFAAENVLPTLEAVGDAAAALGAGSEGIGRITLALGQIQAKGKLAGEEMRQLTEAGIPAWHILSEAMGTTVPALQDMVSKGLIPGGKAVEMLTAGMTKRFGGMMSSMENTWQGVTSSIKDIWRMTVGTLTQTLFGGLNNMLIKLRDFLQQFYNMLQAVMGKKAKQSTAGLTKSTQDQAEAINSVGDAADDTAKSVKNALKAIAGFDEINVVGGNAATDISSITAFSTGGTSAAEKVADAMNEIKDSIKEMSKIEKAYWNFVEEIDPNELVNQKLAVDNLKDSLKNLFLAIGKIGKLKPIKWDKIFGALYNARNTILTSNLIQLTGIVETLTGLLKGDSKLAFKGFGKVTEGMYKSFTPFLELIGKKGLAEKIKKLTSPVNGLKNVMEGLGTETQKSLRAFLNSYNDLDKTIKQINWSDKVVSSNDLSTIKSRLEAVGSAVTENLKSAKEQAIQNINDMYKQYLITESQKKEMLSKNEEFYSSQEKQLKDTHQRIYDIYKKAKDNNVALTDAQKNEINTLMQQLQADSVKTMTSNADEQKLILERLRTNASAISAAQALELVKNAEQAKEKTINAANEQYLETKANIEYQRDVVKSISPEMADKMIEEAKRQRDNVVDEAETQYNNILNEAKTHTKDMKNHINWERKELMSPWEAKWSELVDKATEKLRAIKKAWSDTWDSMKTNLENTWEGIKEAVKKPIKPGIIGGAIGFNIPQIPKFATGGYVRANNPMLAIIGDNRREGEIVSPESKIYEQVMKALRDTGASDRPISLTVQLGNTKIYKELIKGIKNYERQTGISLVSTT